MKKGINIGKTTSNRWESPGKVLTVATPDSVDSDR
jgi:hypothetical protein